MNESPTPVLHLEADTPDGRLVKSLLSLEGIACAITRVEREAAYCQALEQGGFDLILASHGLPDCDLPSALAIARRLRPEVPFVCLADASAEDLAIEMLRKGATDYVLKQRLTRLGPVVRRALAERRERQQRRAAEDAATAVEQQLRQAQTLESLGRLAGGIAHDFNNLLTVISGHCDRLLDALDDAPARADVALIVESCQRASNLTRQLLALGRRQTATPRHSGLNDVVRDMARLLERVLGEHTTVITMLGPGVGTVPADAHQIEQILVNLAINARDAMPGGGTITIETKALNREALAGLPDGHYVQLSVGDTGHGMDAATAARVFEPFFTTKPPGEGTGLGLSTVSGIVARMGGRVSVESHVGQGTTMRVVLPHVVATASPAPLDTPAVAASPARTTRTLLLVEDEDFVRELVRDYLRAAGYRVLESGSGEDALALVESDEIHVDLLITDVVLPGINGATLAEELSRRMPGMDTLFMSGYAGDSMFGADAFEPGAAFLPKPFTRQQLTDKVREMLSDRPAVPAALVASPAPAQSRHFA